MYAGIYLVNLGVQDLQVSRWLGFVYARGQLCTVYQGAGIYLVNLGVQDL